MKRVNQMGLYRLGNLTRIRALKAGMKPDDFFKETFFPALVLKHFVNDIEYQNTVPAAVGKGLSLWKQLEGQQKEEREKEKVAGARVKRKKESGSRLA